jgi:hypothetical protein
LKRAALLLALALASRAAPGAQAADAGRPPPAAPASDRLPEDPVAGAKSTAQWRTFMAAEEHERRLHYDRDRIKQHRAVLRLLKAARARYDRARTKAAIDAARAGFSATADDVHKRMTEIDHWGNNSNLLADYEALLHLLADDYPAARISSLEGDRAVLDRARAAVGEREQKIRTWLREAASSRDE